MQQAKIVARYDAAESSTSTLRDWTDSDFFQSLASEDAAFNQYTRATTIRRIRWQVRNNPFLAGLYAKFPDAVGFPTLRTRTKDKTYNEATDLAFWRFTRRAGSANESLKTLVELILLECLVGGELFFLMLDNGKVQPIPSEFCGSQSASAINGIEYDSYGLPKKYWFAPVTLDASTPDFSKAKPFDAADVIHVFRKDRVQMGRGLPWLVASLSTAKDIHEIVRAKTKQIKDANSISGTIEKTDAASAVRALNGYTGDLPSTTDGGASAPAGATAERPVLELKAGTFVGLEPGEKLNMLATTYQASDYEQLVVMMLNAVSAPVGLPVEFWFSGLGDVNFSGFKGLGAQWDSRRRDYCEWIEATFLDRYHFWWVSKARKLNKVNPLPAGSDDTDLQWAWKSTAVLDEERSARSAQVRIQAGLTTPADEWERANGEFQDEVLAKRRVLWDAARAAAGLPAEAPPIEWMLNGVFPKPVTPSTPNPNA